LLAKDHIGQTAFHVVAVRGNTEVLKEIWEWAKDDLMTEELNEKLLLAKEKCGVTAWQSAAIRGKIHLLMQLWEFVKEELSTDELKNN
jgi:hypothetical protein